MKGTTPTTKSQVLNPSARCTYWALTVRLIGPAGGSAEIETGQQGATHFVGVNSKPVPCDDGNPCTLNGGEGYGCQFQPLPNGEPCVEDCLQGTCQFGFCMPTGPVVCMPSDECHVAGVCDPQTDTCTNPSGHQGEPCSDGNSCTIGDVCSFGVCSGTPTSDATCDDGDPCTVSDKCVNGICRGTFDRPGEVLHVRWIAGSKEDVTWDAVPGAMAYQVYRGVPAGLVHLLDSVVDSCFKFTTTSTSAKFIETPAAGTFFWYIVRATDNQCLGSPGNATAGRRQQNASGPCP
jgi:hypothetical protein